MTTMNVLIWGNTSHGLQYNNSRFYFDIFENKIEPIPRDHTSIRDLQDIELFISNDKNSKSDSVLIDILDSLPNIYLRIINHPRFIKRYDNYLSKFKDYEFNYKKHKEIVCEGFGLFCNQYILRFNLHMMQIFLI